MDPRDLIGTIMTEPIQPEFDGDYVDARLVVPAKRMDRPPALQRRDLLLQKLRGRGGLSSPRKTKPSAVALVMIEFRELGVISCA